MGEKGSVILVAVIHTDCRSKSSLREPMGTTLKGREKERVGLVSTFVSVEYITF